MGSTGQTVSIWGPFAGYGTRREHVAWLLQGLGDRAEELRDTITDLFGRRQIPGAQVDLLQLTGKGIAIEQRPFYRIQRGLATVWLYVVRFGQDLYVSQVPYVKGPLSILRFILAGLALLVFGVWLLNGFVVYIAGLALPDLLLSGGRQADSLGFFLPSSTCCCCISPLGIASAVAMSVGIGYSLYKFLTEKDILALFRSPPTEFQEDDIVSLEKAVSETVRQSADLIGIDLKLLDPGRAHRSQKRVI
jgi:hypothetical protein